MDIRNLLQLQRTFQGDGIRESTAQIEEIVGVGKRPCEVGHLVVRLQHLADLHGNLAESLHDLQILLTVHRALRLAHRQGNHREHGHLTCERLRRSHADLRAHVDIRTRVCGSWDARTDGVADAVDEGTLLLGQLHGSQRVGRLTALRDGNHHVALAHHGIPVSELRGVLHLHRNAAERLDDLLAYQSRVPRRAAGHDHHALRFQQLAAIVNQRRERHVISLHIHAASHAVRQALRLLEDLLQHEVRIATLLNLSEVDVHRLHLQLLILAEDIHHVQVLSQTDHGYIAVLQIHHLVRIFHDGAGVGT